MQEPGSSVDTDRGRWNAAVAVGDEKTGPREERYAEYSIILAGETDAVSFELRATTRYTSFKLLHRAAKLSLGAAVRPLSVVRYGDCLRNRLRVAERRAPQLNAWLNALLLQPRGRLLVRSFMQFDVVAQRNHLHECGCHGTQCFQHHQQCFNAPVKHLKAIQKAV